MGSGMVWEGTSPGLEEGSFTGVKDQTERHTALQFQCELVLEVQARS